MRNTETLVGFACWSLFCAWVGTLAPQDDPGPQCAARMDGRRLVRTGPGPLDCLYERPALSLPTVEQIRAAQAQKRMNNVKEKAK